MSQTLITAPPVEPVTLQEVKDNSVVDFGDDEALLEAFISAARIWAEMYLNRALVSQTWEYKFDKFPRCGYFELPLNPVQSVESITYTDTSASPNQQTLSTNVYGVDTGVTPARVYLKYGQSWPSNRDYYNDIAVRFVAGYAPSGSPEDYRANVPASIRSAICMMVEDRYQFRGASKDMAHFHNPTIDALLGPHRLYTL